MPVTPSFLCPPVAASWIRQGRSERAGNVEEIHERVYYVDVTADPGADDAAPACEASQAEEVREACRRRAAAARRLDGRGPAAGADGRGAPGRWVWIPDGGREAGGRDIAAARTGLGGAEAAGRAASGPRAGDGQLRGGAGETPTARKGGETDPGSLGQERAAGTGPRPKLLIPMPRGLGVRVRAGQA